MQVCGEGASLGEARGGQSSPSSAKAALNFDNRLGASCLVTYVQLGGRADPFGVEKGWMMSGLVGRAYTEQRLGVLLRGSKSFTISFILPGFGSLLLNHKVGSR